MKPLSLCEEEVYLVRWKKEKSWEKISLGEKERKRELVCLSPPLLKVETVETGKRQKSWDIALTTFSQKSETLIFFSFFLFCLCFMLRDMGKGWTFLF